MANHFAETSRESIENFWRALRHCDENPSCRVVPGVAENNFYPAVQPMRDLNGGEELTINFRNVPRATLDGFPWIAAIIADKVAAYDNGTCSIVVHIWRIKNFGVLSFLFDGNANLWRKS